MSHRPWGSSSCQCQQAGDVHVFLTRESHLPRRDLSAKPRVRDLCSGISVEPKKGTPRKDYQSIGHRRVHKTNSRHAMLKKRVHGAVNTSAREAKKRYTRQTARPPYGQKRYTREWGKEKCSRGTGVAQMSSVTAAHASRRALAIKKFEVIIAKVRCGHAYYRIHD